MYLYFFVVAFLASAIGGICGIGGGIIIKPLLDATGTLPVRVVSFLSGTTVLSMTLVSVLQNLAKRGRGEGARIESATTLPLALGSILGGVAGKRAFDLARLTFGSEALVGLVQAALLVAITAGTFAYTLAASRIRTLRVRGVAAKVAIGFLLGIVSSFLGIGGGPINICFLSFFFSMDARTSVINSLFVILFSQLASLASGIAFRSIPPVEPGYLAAMIAAGVAGGMLGRRIHSAITMRALRALFLGCMGLIVAICAWNIALFARAL